MENKIGKLLEAFEFGPIQDVLNVLLTLKNNDITIDEFMSWVEDEQKALIDREHTGYNHLGEPVLQYVCPKCGDALLLINVNSRPCSMVGGGYKTMFSCLDIMGCDYSLFSTHKRKYWEEIIRDLG